MYKRKLIRVLAMLLVAALLLPMGVSASTVETIQPRSSLYLDSYNAYVYPAGNGKIQVYFSVFGTRYMDTLGSLRIEIYESTDNSNWIWKRTFTNERNPELIGYDDYFHSGHVDYQGVAGRYYRAYVCIWAGKDGDGDTRYFYTSSKLAS